MQMNKQIVVILILASLLFSAIGAAYYFYNKNQQAIKSKNQLVTVYIAKEDLKRNTLIELKHLAQTKIAKQYILNKPLLKKEILGKYTKEKIYKNEVFLKQKLNTKIQKDRAKILDFTKGSYNMQFGLFQNPNFTLVQGDMINIISVYPEGTPDRKGNYSNFDVQYIAKNLKVLGFIRDGRTESETITKHKVKKVVKKKVVEEVIDVKADELILDVDPFVLISLIKDYNKGNQLWMVKTKESILIDSLDNMTKNEQLNEMVKSKDKEFKVLKEQINQSLETTKLDNISVSQKSVSKPKVYTYKWYRPKATTIKKSAVIDYSSSGDEKTNSTQTKSVNIVIDSAKQCRIIKDKLVKGDVNYFYIRNEASTKSSNKKVLSKNTVIPYISYENGWYKTCDGQYVNEKVVSSITYNEAVKKIGKR